MAHYTTDQERPFRVDYDGNIVGPGVHIPPSQQLAPGKVLVDTEMLNHVYRAGVIAGQLLDKTIDAKRVERLSLAVASVNAPRLPPGTHVVRLVDVKTDPKTGELVEVLELSNGTTLEHVVKG